MSDNDSRIVCASRGQADPALSVEAVRQPGQLDALRHEWTALHAGAPGVSPFVAWEWVGCWWNAFPRRGQMLNLLVRDETGGLAAIAPLMRVTRGWKGLGLREIRFASDYSDIGPADLDFIIAAGAAGPALRQVLGCLCSDPWWDRLWLARLRADSPNLQALCDAAAECGLRIEIRQRLPAAYVALPDSLDKYLATLGTKTRDNVRRWQRRFTAQYGGQAKRCEDAAEVERVLACLMEFKVQRMRDKGQDTQFSRVSYRRFLSQACRSFAERSPSSS